MKEHHLILNKTIPFFLFLFVVSFCNAQTTTVRASVDRNNILIGEQINLVLEADIPENEPISFFEVDSIEHFEFLLKGKIDTTNTSKGTELKQLFRLTSFDSGRWVIPAYSLAHSENLKTDSIVINVGFMAMDTTKDYNDIKEIIEIEAEKKQDWTWYYVGGGVLLLALLIYLLTRKKKKKAVDEAAATQIADPYRDAMEGLEQLRQEDYPGKGDTKKYYTLLTDIFRTYVEKRKGIHSLQQTTDDLVVQLKNVDLHKDQYSQLSQVLRLSDFVKFAKYESTDADNKNVFDTIKKSIEEIERAIPATAIAAKD